VLQYTPPLGGATYIWGVVPGYHSAPRFHSSPTFSPPNIHLPLVVFVFHSLTHTYTNTTTHNFTMVRTRTVQYTNHPITGRLQGNSPECDAYLESRRAEQSSRRQSYNPVTERWGAPDSKLSPATDNKSGLRSKRSDEWALAARVGYETDADSLDPQADFYAGYQRPDMPGLGAQTATGANTEGVFSIWYSLPAWPCDRIRELLEYLPSTKPEYQTNPIAPTTPLIQPSLQTAQGRDVLGGYDGDEVVDSRRTPLPSSYRPVSGPFGLVQSRMTFPTPLPSSYPPITAANDTAPPPYSLEDPSRYHTGAFRRVRPALPLPFGSSINGQTNQSGVYDQLNPGPETKCFWEKCDRPDETESKLRVESRNLMCKVSGKVDTDRFLSGKTQKIRDKTRERYLDSVKFRDKVRKKVLKKHGDLGEDALMTFDRSFGLACADADDQNTRYPRQESGMSVGSRSRILENQRTRYEALTGGSR